MGRVLSVCLFVVGVIHLLPLAGVLGASRLSALYGIAVAEPNLERLLRHRAVLFGVLGGLCIAASPSSLITRCGPRCVSTSATPTAGASIPA
jgi:hypothetical protein